MRSNRCIRPLACWFWLAACGGGSTVHDALPPPRLFDPLSYRSLPGPERAFGVREGLLRSYFHRQGPIVVNVLAQSGPNPNVIVRFSGSDRGIGAWFLPTSEDTDLYAGTAPDAERLAAGGGLVAVQREQGEHPLYGVRGALKSTATRLSTELVLLGRSRALRDYTDGVCLEDAARFPELRDERIQLDAARNALRVSREGDSGESSLELLLIGTHGTRIELRERQGESRASCPLAPGQGQPIVDVSNVAGIQLQFVALASDEPPAPDEALAPDVAPAKAP